MEFPQGKHNSKNFNNSWKSSNFIVQFSGKCSVCHIEIEVGENATRGRVWGMTHHRCADGVPREAAVKESNKPIGEGMKLGTIRNYKSRNFDPKSKTSFKAIFGARCKICGIWIAKGENAVSGRQGGIAHVVCSERKARIIQGQVDQNPRPPRETRIKGEFRFNKSRRGNATVKREELNQSIGLIIGRVACTVCRINKGIPCLNSGAQWVHQSRVASFETTYE